MPHVLAQDLRNAVLQAAMSGRLTQQLDTDSLISVPEIQDDYEEPFEIPNNWKFVYLGDVFNIRSSSRVHQADWRSEGIPFYRAREVVKLSENGFVDNELFISEELYDRFSKSSGVPHPGDLLVSGVGTLGATYIVKDTDRFYYKDASVLCFENINKQNSQFAKYLLQAPYMIQQIYDPSAFGTTVATLTMKRANLFVVALPPVEEQARIVARVDELMAKIDEYEKIETQLTELKKAFPGNMKDAILQAAMQGKLTEQLESDGDVCKLCSDISVKDKKWKPIEEDETHFTIPDNWEWMRLREFSSITAGGTPNRSEPKYWNGDIPWLKIGNMTSKYVTEADEFITEDGLNNSSAKWVKKGTILYSIFASIGTVAILDFDATTNQAIAAVTINERMNRDYMYYVLTALKSVLVGQGHGMAQMNINQEILKNTPIPIPPIEEQQRIVNKLDQLLPLCEQLEKMVA